MKNIHRTIAWILVIFWMGVIFYLSHQPAGASSELSSGITQIVIHIIDSVIPFVQLQEDGWHFFIRKSAHFIAYFMLGILIIHALRVSGLYRYQMIIAITISFLYAISDEVHQLFIPGRSGEVRDVLIDTLGATSGLLIYRIFNLFFKKQPAEH